MKLLGIDTGTGGTRAVVIDEHGKVIASSTCAHEPFASPQPLWAEQDPRDWWRACVAAVRAVLATPGVNADDITAVGLTGQMHGSVLLGESGEVLRPALIWCDQRTDSQCQAITEKIGAARLIELTSNPAITGFTLPKLRWVLEREPEVWSRIRSILLPKDYVRFRLTGERATDAADASGTLLFDVSKRAWSQEMLKLTEIDARWLPEVFESPEISARVSVEGSAATGLRVGTPVVTGAGDQAAGAVGMGIVKPGMVSATIGTSGVVFAATARPSLDPLGRIHTFCHAIPGRWHVMGVTQAAGLSLRWFRDRFGAGADDGRDAYDRLTDEAGSAPAGSDGVLWAPYLMGERTPHLDPNARAALVGVNASHTRAHMIRAILEGVAFSLRDTLTIFKEINVPIEKIRLGGGGARSTLWRQIQSDVYGEPVEILAAEEGAAYGAALLAGVGSGAWSSVDEACESAVKISAQIKPSEAKSKLMDQQYQRFRKMYPALRAISEQ